ncbi:hypothetical protein BT96DRAFT_637442 [Gymnopus androsaceus JB14]|uniref:Uncharacterized protein n=1 Tax=Gymnopus androsaceus JB14 TaxID=1447944 RepID=A0A6A4GHC0_9AGAR|nr:hypothetical protein BT96DRAFT_637442 [Gymnopus androsaceus JB14]
MIQNVVLHTYLMKHRTASRLSAINEVCTQRYLVAGIISLIFFRSSGLCSLFVSAKKHHSRRPSQIPTNIGRSWRRGYWSCTLCTMCWSLGHLSPFHLQSLSTCTRTYSIAYAQNTSTYGPIMSYIDLKCTGG